MIISITGSIGSGKTTVAKLFSKHHFNRIDADEIGHRLLNENKYVYDKAVKKFGRGIIDKNKKVNRKKLGEMVFNDDKKLKKLNSIMHPKIIKEIKNQIKKIKYKCDDKAKIIIDAPLLLETKAKDLVDKIIVVKSNKKNIFKRLNKKYSKQQIEKILKCQMPLNEKLKYADFVIDNNGDLGYLEKQIEDVVKNIIDKMSKTTRHRRVA